MSATPLGGAPPTSMNTDAAGVSGGGEFAAPNGDPRCFAPLAQQYPAVANNPVVAQGEPRFVGEPTTMHLVVPGSSNMVLSGVQVQVPNSPPDGLSGDVAIALAPREGRVVPAGSSG